MPISGETGLPPRPESPHAAFYSERLYAFGETGQLVVPHLDRLAVIQSNGLSSSDTAVITLEDAQVVPNGDPVAETLIAHYEDVVDALISNPDLHDSGQVQWGATSVTLLDRAGHELDRSVKDRLLVSAFVASQFAGHPKDRLAFLGATYRTGYAPMMAAALMRTRYTGLSLVTPDSRDPGQENVRNVSAFSAAFARPGLFEAYLELAQRFVRPEDYADSYELINEAKALYAENGYISSESIRYLRAMSLAAPGIEQYVFDPTKAERFAITEMFIEDLAQVLFPNGSPDALKSELALFRDVSACSIVHLNEDVKTAIRRLAMPVVVRYKQTGEFSLSREQRLAWRYRDIRQEVLGFFEMGSYVDPSISSKYQIIPGNEIYSSATDGAGAGLTTNMPRYLKRIDAAVPAHADASEVIPADDLEAIAQTKRLQLRQLAGATLTDLLVTTIAYEHLLPLFLEKKGDRYNATDPIIPITKSSVQIGRRLMCPAIRVHIEPADERQEGHPVTDLIDALSKIVIDEAIVHRVFVAT